MTATEPRDPNLDRLAAGLGRLLQRLATGADAERGGGTDADGALGPCLAAVFAALQEGHTSAALSAVAASLPADAAERDPTRLRRVLLATGAVADDDGNGAAGDTVALPLVLAGDRVYLLRHFRTERRVAARLRQLLGAPAVAPPTATLDALRALPRQPGADGIDWQNVAVAAAARSRLTVVTGGPGTGKTTTIRKILATLLAGEPALQIALAAPTGKAAARMAEALHDVLAAHRIAPPRTLHRLLGYRALEDSFRHGEHAPLPHDLVVVDEASMVDLELMDALLAALSPTARLLLLGDRDQLASVGAGQVLADLCAVSTPERGTGAALAQFAADHLGVVLPVDPDASPFAAAVTALRHTWRFAGESGIGAFARAQAARRPDDAVAALRAGRQDLVVATPDEVDELLRRCWPALQAQVDATSVEAALDALQQLRILCATRHGPLGRDATVARVEQLLRRHGRRDPGAFYRGQPLLVTANDHQSRLWNGDLGVVWPDDEDRLMAWFRGDGGAPRPFLPLRLPPHETAWAITVHKSQGSEFDEVLVLLPERDSPLLNAPLIYTAVTRARRRATVVARPESLDQALRTDAQRASGLRELLRRPSPG